MYSVKKIKKEDLGFHVKKQIPRESGKHRYGGKRGFHTQRKETKQKQNPTSPVRRKEGTLWMNCVYCAGRPRIHDQSLKDGELGE